MKRIGIHLETHILTLSLQVFSPFHIVVFFIFYHRQSKLLLPHRCGDGGLTETLRLVKLKRGRTTPEQDGTVVGIPITKVYIHVCYRHLCEVMYVACSSIYK